MRDISEIFSREKINVIGVNTQSAKGFSRMTFNFLGQEPGSEAEIQQFCQLTYDVSFPMFSKISVAGDDTHPLYQQLTAAQPQSIGEGPLRERLASKEIPIHAAPAVLWNFEKFLVGRDGKVIARFAPDVAADDARLREAIEAALAA